MRRMKTCIMCRNFLVGSEALGRVCNACLDKHTKAEIDAAKRHAHVRMGGRQQRDK